MSYVEGSTGAMLQGVSQQPARLRTEGQVTQQENYDSDVAKGLTARPASVEVTALEGATEGMKFTQLLHKGVQYTVGHTIETLELWRDDGSRLVTTFVEDEAYVRNDMVFLSDETEQLVMCLNRNRETLMHFNPPTERPFNAALVTCLGGQFSRTYKVQVTVGSDTIEFEYVTPAGSAAAHAPQTSSDFIVESLKTAFDALTLPAGLAGMTAKVAGSTLMLEFTSSMSVTADDGENGAVLRAVSDTAKDITHLPDTAKHGHVVKVEESRSEDDDYYLAFNSDVSDVDGEGFGEPGVWREVADPTIVNNFLLVDMPHKIVIDDDAGTATFSRLEWLSRRAGDDNTNPVPSFIGHPIRDIGTFEGRLAILAAGSIYMSRSDNALDLWKKSATVDAADDPIDIASTAINGVQLDWMVPFDKDLLLVSDPGSAQFVVKGGGLTPSNASMVLTTEYYVDSGVRPVSTGRTIILPYKTGKFIGVNEFFTNDLVATNGADPLTISQDRYIPGKLTNMQSAENFSRLLLQSDDNANTVYLYRYLWSGTERLQSAWHVWKFTTEVRHMFFDSSSVFVVLRPPEDAAAAVLCKMDLNRIEDDVGFHITLDRRRDVVVGAGSTIEVALPDAVVVQRAGCEQAGLLAPIELTEDLGGGLFRYTLGSTAAPAGATVTVGEKIMRTLLPTMPLAKNFRGEVVSKASLKVKAFDVHLEESGDMTATRVTPYREDTVLTARRFPRDDDPLDPLRTGRKDYIFRVPWREDSTRSELKLSTGDIRPDTILEIEWSGDLTKVRRRI